MQEARAPVATCLRLSPKVRRIGAPTHEEGCRHVFEHRYLEAVTTVAYFTLISQGQAAWYWKLLAWGEGKEPPSGLGEQPFPHRDSSVTLTLPVHPCCSFGPDSPISSQSWFLLILFDSAQTSPSLSTLSRGRGLLLWFSLSHHHLPFFRHLQGCCSPELLPDSPTKMSAQEAETLFSLALPCKEGIC